jgi:hypothetical protein
MGCFARTEHHECASWMLHPRCLGEGSWHRHEMGFFSGGCLKFRGPPGGPIVHQSRHVQLNNFEATSKTRLINYSFSNLPTITAILFKLRKLEHRDTYRPVKAVQVQDKFSDSPVERMAEMTSIMIHHGNIIGAVTCTITCDILHLVLDFVLILEYQENDAVVEYTGPGMFVLEPYSTVHQTS